MTNAREQTFRLLDLLRREQSAMADFLLALAAFDRCRLWQELGHTSLFTFLHRELRLSKGASHFRKVAAELVQRYPEVIEPLRDGRLCITSVVELAKVMTPGNRAEVLPRFFHTSKKEAKEVSAELRPMEAAPHRLVVTAARPVLAHLTATAQTVVGFPAPSESLSTSPALPVRPGEPCSGELPMTPPPPSARSKVEPLTAELRRLHMTVSKRFMKKLEAAHDALSHSHPGADVEEILEAGLDLLIDRAARRKGICPRPKAEKPPASTAGEPASDHIPAAVKREVWVRDGGCCQWPLDGGGICGSTHRLQFDHIVPRAHGGKSTVAGVRVLCASHNLMAARRIFGDAVMDRYAPARRPGAPVGAE